MTEEVGIIFGALPRSGTVVKGYINNLDPFTKGTASKPSKNFFAWN